MKEKTGDLKTAYEMDYATSTRYADTMTTGR